MKQQTLIRLSIGGLVILSTGCNGEWSDSDFTPNDVTVRDSQHSDGQSRGEDEIGGADESPSGTAAGQQNPDEELDLNVREASQILDELETMFKAQDPVL